MKIKQPFFRSFEKLNSTFKLLLVLASLSFSANAQNAHQLDNLLQQSSNEALVTSTDDLKKLAYGLVPSVYLNQNNLKVDDRFDSPIRIVTDVKSIEALYEFNSVYDDVQMIIVQINNEDQLTKFLKASYLNHYEHLKYAYISCSFELCEESADKDSCEKSKIKSIFDGELSNQTTVVYTANQSK